MRKKEILMGNINAAIKEKMYYLSSLSETDYPFISLYLNINAHELFEQAEKNRIFLKNSFQKAENRIKEQKEKENLVSFKNDEKKILSYIEKQLNSKIHGIAVFACDKLGIFETFQSLMPFENSFNIGSFPYLKQLAFHADEYENTLVVMADSKYARIFNIKLGGFVINELDIENNVHRFHKQGGWSQARYQRHIEKQIEQHYKEISEIVTEFLDREHYDNLILFGQHHEIKNLEANFSKRVNTRIIDINSLQMRENINEILETVINDLYKTEKKKEFRIIRDIIEKSRGGGFESLGIQETIELAKDGRIRILAAVKDHVYEGWKCGECLYLTKDQHHGGCPKCNGNMKQTDLIEEAVRLTLKNGGEVEFVENEAAVELENNGELGAYLRY